MKVLCLTNNLDRPEAFLMRGLKERGVDLTLVMDKKSPFQQLMEGSQIPIYHHHFKGRIAPSSIAFVRKLLKKGNFDLVHSFNARALTSAIIAGTGMQIKHVAYRGTVGHLSWLDPTALISFFHPKLSRVICVSDAVKKYMLSKGLKPHKVVRIYKGHDVKWYENASNCDLKEFAIPSAAFTVSCSANMRPVKGVDVLIEAFRHIPAQLPIHLLLIGDIRDDTIGKELSDHPRKEAIHTTGFRSDAPAIVRATDLFCMPSREREGLPKALIEAMIQAIPAIVTEVGGMPEIVIDNVNGLVVPPENALRLASAIIKMYEEPELRKAMALKAKQRIVEDFAIENTIKQTYDLYCECLKSE